MEEDHTLSAHETKTLHGLLKGTKLEVAVVVHSVQLADAILDRLLLKIAIQTTHECGRVGVNVSKPVA